MADRFHAGNTPSPSTVQHLIREATSDGVTGVPRDTLQRPIRDLRLSVIDQCNFRCTYCMPKEIYGPGFSFLTKAAKLSRPELVRVAKAFVSLGVEKIRLTGGEPLLRKDLEFLIEDLVSLRTNSGEAPKIALTTNGSLLAARATSLKNAGLQRVTVSLDSLDDKLFRRISDVNQPVQRILDGIAAAEAAGLQPIKINCVVERGVNEDQVLPLINFFRHSSVNLRFIEYMDVEGPKGWTHSRVVDSREIRARISESFQLEPIARQSTETAENFSLSDGSLNIGFISSISHPFCGDCVRARVSADGRLHLCLFATSSIDLRPFLTHDDQMSSLQEFIATAWKSRTDRYSELRSSAQGNGKNRYRTVRMSLVGG